MFVSFFAYITAALVIFPLVSFFIIYLILYLLTMDKKFTLSWTINSVTILLIFSISVTTQELFQFKAFWILFIVLMLLAAGLLYLQLSLKGQIHWQRLISASLKLSFLLFAPIHVILYLWAVIDAILNL